MAYIQRLILLGFALLTVSPAQLTVDAEIRPRFEIRDGYKLLSIDGQAPAVLISQRSRLSLYYSKNQLSTRFSLQDVRVWGDESNVSSTGVTGDPASLDLHEAWAEYRTPAGFDLRIGRQVFNIDDQRLISQRNWNQNGLSYDALRLRYAPGDWQFDLALSLNNNQENTDGNLYPADRLKTLNFLYIQGPLSEQFSNSLILLGSGVTANDSSEVIYMRGTLGDYWHFSGDKLDLQGSVYYQFGKNKSGRVVSAFLGSVDGLIQIQSLKTGGGLVYISGQDAARSSSDYQNTDHLFDLLYGTRHSNYGLMDYFSDIPKGTGGGGLLDVCLKLQYGADKTSLQLDAHRFYLANRVLLNSDPDPIDKYLGTEFDLSLKWKLHPAITLQGGYSVMRPGESLERIQGLNPSDSDWSHWFWLMLDVKSVLFQET
ncbi:MAG: alginate export family protein [Candidatus Marinimicrobia bacterium]|nr:alginate export family protein [Candidatus Neomarinimicrobiota bacterium]